MIGGIPGYMGPPPIDPTPIQPQGGNTSTGGYPSGGNGGGGTGGGSRMAFNPMGGIGMNIPTFQGGPTYAGGGPGWMPPPPIGDPYGSGYRINPYDNRPIGNRGGNVNLDNVNMLPPLGPVGPGGGTATTSYIGPSRPRGWSPQRMPVVQPQIPGWAGYIQWLSMMGGGRMPPPPIGGI